MSELPFSPFAEAKGLVFTAGQLALVDGAITSSDITEQTHRAIDAVERVLRLAGLTLNDVIKTTVWLTRASDIAAFNAAYVSRFVRPLPARSTVVTDLVVPGALIEIEAIASRDAAQFAP